jgi:hypothetical protein
MTARQLTFHPAAIAEAEDVSRWYGKRSKLPQSSKGTRRAKLPCFPFFLVYRVMDARVEVIAVAHGHRRPEYWQERL